MSHRGSVEALLRGVKWNLKKNNGSKVLPSTMMFRPESAQHLLWDIFIMLLIMYFAVAVPIRLAFKNAWYNDGLEAFFTACFVLDIFIVFNTALRGPGGIYITDRKAIAQEYLLGWFFIDAVATFPFEVVTAGDDAGVNRIGRSVKIFRLLRIVKVDGN